MTKDELQQSLRAAVVAAFAAAAAIVLWDTAAAVRRPPGVPVDGGLLVFVVVGVSLVGLGGSAVLAARLGARAALARFGGLGAAALGALDAAVLYGLAVTLQDPRSVEPGARPLVLAVLVAAGAGLGRLAHDDPRRGRILAVAAAIVAVLGATRLRWLAEDWTRLALHGLWFGAAAALLGRRGSWRLAAGLVAGAVVALVAAGPLLSASPSARRLLWGRSSHVHAWLYALGPGRDRPGRVWPAPAEDSAAAAATLSPGARPPDVVIVSVDSWRWDLGDAMPRTTRALGPHARFTRAVSPSSRTSATVASMLRGRRTRDLRLEEGVPGAAGQVAIHDPSPTIGHVLAVRGYRVVTVPTDALFEPRAGLAAGFETVFAAAHDAQGLGLTWQPFQRGRLRAAPALRVLARVAARTPGPLCAWIHLMDSHTPFFHGEAGRGPDAREGLVRSLGWLDGLLVRFLGELEQARGARPLLALFGDHGEEFGEHGGVAHASTVHAEQVRVAFTLAGPGVPALEVDAPVSVASVVPTLLELAGQPVPVSMSEPSLAPALRGRRPWPRLAVSEVVTWGRRWVGLTGVRDRAILDPVHHVAELYDSARDPLEQHDLADSEPARLAALLRLGREP